MSKTKTKMRRRRPTPAPPRRPLPPPVEAMKITPMDRATGGAILRHRLQSRDWWIVAVFCRDACALLERIERRFYAGECNEEFQAVAALVPGVGPGAFALLHKRWMGPHELHALVRELCPACPITEGELTQRDVLFPDPDTRRAQTAAAWFVELVDAAPAMQ